ncbi:MAG: KOW domain-containing RNA-binding protein [Clostridia bacterium]|nr:KOW domain-containing RNA-binding protein [Clostridia bacterium]
MIGRIAVSTQGRDKGRAFIIVDTPEENFVMLCDGELRRLEKPKRKKLKHIKLLAIDPVEIPETNKKLNELIKNISQSYLGGNFRGKG